MCVVVFVVTNCMKLCLTVCHHSWRWLGIYRGVKHTNFMILSKLERQTINRWYLAFPLESYYLVSKYRCIKLVVVLILTSKKMVYFFQYSWFKSILVTLIKQEYPQGCVIIQKSMVFLMKRRQQVIRSNWN